MKKSVELVSIIKSNRENDLEEWVNYYLYIGFDKINIFNNDSNFSVSSLFEKNKNVNVIDVPGDYGYSKAGYRRHTNLIGKFFMEKKESADWIAWFDDDEFLYLKNHNNIKDILNDDYSAICFFWKFISSNNIMEDRDTTLIDTFNYVSLNSPCKDNAHIKTMVNCKKFNTIRYETSHSPIINETMIKKGMVTSDGREVKNEFEKITGMDFYDKQDTYIYHYFHQTIKDRIFKIARGKSNNEVFYQEDMEEFKREILGKYIYLDNTMKDLKNSY